MILTDIDILKHMENGYITITPFNRENLGSNSYDLTLSKHLLTYTGEELDCKIDNPYTRFEIPEEGILLLPGKLYLGSTAEYTKTKQLAPFIEGKSSVGRLGITAHITAGVGDVGFDGYWTLEITVVMPTRVYAGMPIAQIQYFTTLGQCGTPYSLKQNAKYSGQSHLPISSQMFKNFKHADI